MLQCFVCSPIPKVSEKKWATGQSFIRKEITGYRIGTLVLSVVNFDQFLTPRPLPIADVVYGRPPTRGRGRRPRHVMTSAKKIYG